MIFKNTSHQRGTGQALRQFKKKIKLSGWDRILSIPKINYFFIRPLKGWWDGADQTGGGAPRGERITPGTRYPTSASCLKLEHHHQWPHVSSHLIGGLVRPRTRVIRGSQGSSTPTVSQ